MGKSRYSFAKWILAGLVLIAAALAALYAATPAIVAALSPSLAARYGLAALEIDIDHPHWRHVNVRRLLVVTEQVELSGTEARVEYSWPDVFDGRLDAVAFAELNISVFSSRDSASSDDARVVGTQYLTPPVRRMSVEKLEIRTDTGFLGVGQAKLGDGLLSFAIEGIEPEAASRLSLTAELDSDGKFNARFSERHDAAAEYLNLDGLIGAATISLNGRLQLQGFALQLASDIVGIPAGSGSVDAEVRTTLPWPLPESGQWPDIVASIPAFQIDWQSANEDVRLEAIKGAVEIAGRDLTGSVSGVIELQRPERNMTVNIPKQYPFSYEDGLLTGPGGLGIELRDGTGETRASLHSFSFVPGPEAKLDVDADLKSSFDTIDIDGRAKSHVVIEQFQPLRITGRFGFDGAATTSDQQRDVAVESSFILDGDDLSVEGAVSSGIFDDVPFALEHDLETGAGEFNARKMLVFDDALAASVMAGWENVYDLDAGRMDATVKLGWRTGSNVTADLELALENGRAHYEKNTAVGIAALLQLRSYDVSDIDAWKLEPAHVTVRQVDAGLPINDLGADLSWTGNLVEIANMQASVLGGHAYAGPLFYDIESGNSEFSLRLEDIDLAEVLALEGDDIVGTGKLDGSLPIVFTNSEASVKNGSVQARPPGGTIRLTSTFAGPSGQPGLDFALLALKDFNYNELRAEVSYSENGDLDLAVHLQGSNPAVEQGRAILYNLNISENIPLLLESLHLQDRVSEQLEKRVN